MKLGFISSWLSVVCLRRGIEQTQFSNSLRCDFFQGKDVIIGKAPCNQQRLVGVDHPLQPPASIGIPAKSLPVDSPVTRPPVDDSPAHVTPAGQPPKVRPLFEY